MKAKMRTPGEAARAIDHQKQIDRERKSVRSVNEQIGFCIATAGEKLRKENTCEHCGEMPCSGIECLQSRVDGLESDLQNQIDDLAQEVETGGRW